MKKRLFPPQTTLEEARNWLMENAEDGAECPCCQQFVKIYKRRLNAGMARTLIWVANHSRPGEWLDLSSAPKFIHKNREHGKLAHWGILEQKPSDDPKKKDSGIWRATIEGRGFAMNIRKARSHVYLYDNKVLNFTDELVTVIDALGEEFDYEELMQATPDGLLR